MVDSEEAELLLWISLLADDIGPRRPTGVAERRAAEVLAEGLSRLGVDARLEAFRGYSSFALPFAITVGTAVAPELLPRRLRRLRAGLAALAAGMLATEGCSASRRSATCSRVGRPRTSSPRSSPAGPPSAPSA